MRLLDGLWDGAVRRCAMSPVVLFVLVLAVVVPGYARAEGFGLHKFDVQFAGPGGEVQLQAGSHPFAYTTSFEVNLDEGGFPVAAVKELSIAQVPGLVGIPGAVPRCSTLDFLSRPVGKVTPDTAVCANGSAVGLTTVKIGGEVGGEHATENRTAPVYNLEPPPGVAAKLGFYIANVPVTVDINVSEEPPYEIIASVKNISEVLEFYGAKFTIWGVPGSPVHDSLRGSCVDHNGESVGLCPAGSGEVPFLVSPRACNGPLAGGWEADSWLDPSTFVSGGSVTHDDAEPPNPEGFTGCGSLGFEPSTVAVPTAKEASSPTGLDFHLDVADEGLTNPKGLAGSDIRSATVTLPEGMTVNPSQGVGLAVCSQADLARETARSAAGEGCPEASKIGTIEVETPLLPEQLLKGSLYVAAPYENQFGSLLAFYFVIKDPTLGIIVKQAAKVTPDPISGRLTTTTEDMPQLPFSHFRLHFREGARSPLVSPPTCGSYQVKAELAPWSGSEPVVSTSAFQIITGPNETPCPTGATPPFKPGLVAGTQNNAAGSYSPFYLRVERHDGEQEITGFSTQLPAGLTGNLTGIPFCTDAEIQHAGEQTGAEAETNPACPAASQIGHTIAEAGVGGLPAQTPGKLYLAGPFEGAPFSVVSITSAKVGPFDLGTVVVHLPLQIDPITAQVSIPSSPADQIPHIIKGIVIHLRTIRVYIDRQHFMINPTNCEPTNISASIIGSGASFTSPTDDQAANVTNHFQTVNCANLAFKPVFQVSTSGRTSRKLGASLNVKLAYPKAAQGTQANIRMVKVDLPKQLPSRLTTLQQACTAKQFEANPAGCPAASRVGQATAVTPALPVALTGPAFFVSHGGAKFPELIIVLQGYGVTVDLHGETFINKAGITSSTFRTVPDQPVTSFELTLPQGPNSALAANGNLCALTKTVLVKHKLTAKIKGRKKTVTRKVATTRPATLSMPTIFTAQNGKTLKQSTPIEVTDCPKTKTKKKK